MDAATEGEMIGRVALDVKPVRIREVALVPVCRPGSRTRSNICTLVEPSIHASLATACGPTRSQPWLRTSLSVFPTCAPSSSQLMPESQPLARIPRASDSGRFTFTVRANWCVCFRRGYGLPSTPLIPRRSSTDVRAALPNCEVNVRIV
jgi:hypothetical protein